MINKLKTLGLALSVTVISSLASAQSLPEGSFLGNSNLIRYASINADAMAFLIKRDPQNRDRYYAILAEYNRIPGTTGHVRLALTRWVPRMYAYRIDKVNDRLFALRKLQVNEAGDIVVDENVTDGAIRLRRNNNIGGAVLTRTSGGGTQEVQETIQIIGRVGSTWEDYVVGRFFGTQRSSGLDYLANTVNMELSQDRIANFFMDDVRGQFNVSEKLPGLYTFVPRTNGNVGNEKVVGRIGVFIDIVNWKPRATTEELLLINPNNGSDVGFFYERHDD